MVAHTFKHSIWETESVSLDTNTGSFIQASQGYKVRPCIKTKQQKITNYSLHESFGYKVIFLIPRPILYNTST